MSMVPVVIENKNGSERSFDVYSRLLRDRIIFLHGEVEDGMADTIIAQLLLLEAEDPDKDIFLYINSPGGSCSAGLAIKNVMDYISCDVQTIGLGCCASMGAFLLASGTQGKRFSLKDTEIMIHQPLGGAKGQASDIQITARHIQQMKEKLTKYLSDYTNGKTSYEDMYEMCDRDNWLSAESAMNIGLVDQVLEKRPK
ncbi:MAG: ATP-dependent Clp protease proteolytic subunit [Paraclostridium sp.]